jgi:hypothetical protein
MSTYIESLHESTDRNWADNEPGAIEKLHELNEFYRHHRWPERYSKTTHIVRCGRVPHVSRFSKRGIPRFPLIPTLAPTMNDTDLRATVEERPFRAASFARLDEAFRPRDSRQRGLKPNLKVTSDRGPEGRLFHQNHRLRRSLTTFRDDLSRCSSRASAPPWKSGPSGPRSPLPQPGL